MPITPNENYTPTKGEFLNSVLNKIGKQEFVTRQYNNPLARLKGGFIDGPTDIEEIYVARCEDTGYDKEGKGVLDRVKPKVAVQYHTDTVEHGYKTTYHFKEMRKGFKTKEALGTMANAIITSLHTGQNIDDQQDCIDVLQALVNAPVPTDSVGDIGISNRDNKIQIPEVTDEETARRLTKEIQKAIPKMSDWNGKYSDVPNYANPEELILFIDSDVDVEVKNEYLAGLFNMSMGELNKTTKMIIPNMKTKLGNKTIAVLCHEKCLKINPTFYDIGSTPNTRGKFVNTDLVTETLKSYTTWYPFLVIQETP